MNPRLISRRGFLNSPAGLTAGPPGPSRRSMRGQPSQAGWAST